ncbi:hypothetical protein J6590_008874 [Homalodisca vitripennis]|nr:hypothetical protein J6590_008874 [Homalodisca vitripennis]
MVYILVVTIQSVEALQVGLLSGSEYLPGSGTVAFTAALHSSPLTLQHGLHSGRNCTVDLLSGSEYPPVCGTVAITAALHSSPLTLQHGIHSGRNYSVSRSLTGRSAIWQRLQLLQHCIALHLHYSIIYILVVTVQSVRSLTDRSAIWQRVPASVRDSCNYCSTA